MWPRSLPRVSAGGPRQRAICGSGLQGLTMQVRPTLPQTRINDDVLRTPRWFWLLAGALALVIGGGVICEGLLIWLRLQLGGGSLRVQVG